MLSVRNAMSAFPGDSQRTETLRDSSEPIVVIVTCFLSLRSVCHYTCEIHSAFRSQTQTAFVYLFWGVTLKPWSRATHRFSFEWHPDIPIRYRCVTVFLSSFCLVLLSAALFPLFHSPSYTPTYTYTHTHTNENELHWSWRSTTAAPLITLRHRSLWTQLFQRCGQAPISIATFFFFLPRRA